MPFPQRAGGLRSGPAVAAVVGAAGAIGGFTGANAWSAPDLPGAKSYDFGLSLGPVLVTPDEYRAGPEWESRLESAALNTALRPGELLVAGLGGGSPVSRGDVVEVSVEAIGVLRNPVS